MSDAAAPSITPTVISSGPSTDQLSDWFGLAADAPAEGADAADAGTDEADEPAVDADAAEPTADASADEGAAKDPAAPAAERKQSLPFTIIGADGKPLDAATLDGLKVELKGAGKKEALSIADVVRRASSEAGAVRHAHKVEGTLAETQRAAEQMRQRIEAATREQQTLRDIARRAVTDEDFREQLRAELEEYESPENQLARLHSERRAEQETRQRQQQHQQTVATATQFFEGAVVPAFDGLLAKNPTLSFEELLGRFHSETAGLAVNGVIPPQQYAKVQELLNGSLASWAKARHGERSKLTDEARKERANAQASKNRLARAVAPSNGGTGAPSTAPKPNGSGQPLSYKDAQRRAFAAFTE